MTESDENLKKILYLGNDSSYWATIKSRITQKYNSSPIVFETISFSEKANWQIVHLEVLKILPQIIFIDFSSNLDFALKLAHLLKRENALKSSAVIGFVEKKINVVDCIFAGVGVIHVKCGEYHDIIYDAFFLAFPEEVVSPDFAEAKFKKDVELICDMRLGFITPTGIHAEGNVKIDPGANLKINSEVPARMVPSKKFICRGLSEFNNYFDYKYNYEFEFVGVDTPEFDDEALEKKLEGLDENQRVLIIKTTKENRRGVVDDYQNRLSKTKKDLSEWVLDNMDRIKPKKIKILIIDKGLKFLSDPRKILNNYPYVIRTQTCLTQDLKDIKVLRPDLISFQFFDLEKLEEDIEEHFETGLKEDGTPYAIDEVDSAKEEMLKNFIENCESLALDQLSLTIKTIQSLEAYNPFVILFNCHSYTSQSIQESFKYPFVIVNKKKIELDSIIEMAALLEKRNDKKIEERIDLKIMQLKKTDPVKYRALSKKDFVEKKYYLSHKNPLSQVSTTFPIELQSITESELSFSSKTELDIGTYRLEFPVQMSIQIVLNEEKPFIEDGDFKIYKALIHSVGEGDKKKLRQFVNEIFFAELNQKRKEESTAFKELNENEKMKRSLQEEGEESGEEVEEGGSKGDGSNQEVADS